MSNRQTKEYIWHSLRAYLSLLWANHPWRTLISLSHTVSSIILTVAVPYIISLALADIILGNQQSFWNHIVALSVAVALVGLGNSIGFATAIRLAARMERLATNLAFEHLLSRGVNFHANNPSGKLVANATEYGKSAIRVLFDLLFSGLIPYVLSSLIGIGIVFFHSAEIGAALAGVYVITVIMTLLDSRRRSNVRVKRKRVQDMTVANIADVITNTQATKTFAREADELDTNDRLQQKLLQLRFQDWTRAAIIGSLRLTTLLILQVIFIIFVAQKVQSNPDFLGVGIYAFTYTLGMVGKLFELGALLRTGEEALLGASTMTKFLLESPEIVDAPNASKLKLTAGAISLSNVSFAYPDETDKLIFDNFSLDIPAGQKIGLVGHSGGGKSSLTRLLLRFDDIQSGTITIDGQDISRVTQHSLRESIGYVPQEPLLFHRSIRDNIAYGKPDATDEQIIEAAKKAYADEFITDLPDGIDTIVGERGVKLSGGQRQRIAIARTILKDAPILVLDEATSALDSESEVYIQKALGSLMSQRTSIVIAHRLSTIAKLDRIIVLEKGKVVEDGSHTELLAKDGVYVRLWNHQSGGFIDE